MPIPTPAEVAGMLAACRSEWLPRVYPAGKLRGGVFYIGNPEGDPGDSMPIPLKSNGKRNKDFAGDFSGDDLALFGRARGHGDNMKAAYNDAVDWLGLARRHTRRERPQAPPSTHERTYFTGSWIYTDDKGEPWIEICRFDPPGARKEFRQYNLKQKKWTGSDGGTLPEKRPLYNLPTVVAVKDERIVFVAGEKCADTLGELGITATTNMGGEKALEAADLAPLAGRTVWIWRDNDQTGQVWETELVRYLRAIGSLPLLVPIPAGAREKWDVADAVEADGWGLDEIGDLLDQARAPPTKLVCVTAFEFVSMKLPERSPIFGPFLSRQSLVMVVAERGVGKTWAAMNIAYAAATGGRWLKWSAARPLSVLYLDGEMPAPWFQERWQKIMASPQTRPMEKSLNLRLVTPDLQVGTMPDIGSPEGRENIAELLPGVELVVVDNISTLVRTGVENEEESWIPIQEWSLGLRKLGIAVLYVHHAGKSGKQRGTSKREDILDSVLSLRHPMGYQPDDGARFEIHFEKSRSFAGTDAESILAWADTNPDGTQSWLWEPCQADKQKQVMELHAQGKSVRAIAALTDLSKSTIERWLQKAQAT